MNTSKNSFWFWLFLAPSIISLFVILGIPFFWGIFYSFSDWNGMNITEMVGFKHYIALLSDHEFIDSLIFTASFAFVNIISVNSLGLFFAILFVSKVPTTKILKTIVFIPNLIGGLVLGYIWQFIFVNIFPLFGLNGWLSSTGTGFWGLVLLTVWQMSGYTMLIYISYIYNIPTELNDAAKIDGTSKWQRIKFIIIPIISPAFTINSFIALSNSVKLFDQNLSLTNGDPFKSTQMVSLEIYNTAFTQNLYSYAQAKAVVFFILVALIALMQSYLNKKRELEM